MCSSVDFSDVPSAMQLALELCQSGELKESAKVCGQILNLEADNAEALHLLAVIAHKMGKNKEAVIVIEKALSIDHASFLYHNTAGNIYRALNKPDVAAACYKRAITLKPDFHEALNNLGVLLAEQGKLDEAIDLLYRALALKSDSYKAHNDLGNVLYMRGKLDEAVAHFNRALILKPDFYVAHNNLGVVLAEQGKLDAAVVSYNHAISLKPDYYVAHNNLGAALKEQEKLNEAVAHFARALSLNPAYHEAYNNLGAALTAQKKLDEAVACYKRAIDLKPDYYEAYNNLGNVLSKLDRTEEAKASFLKALELRHNCGIEIKLASLMPAVMPSGEAISRFRREFNHAIDNFLSAGIALSDPLKDVGTTNFYLAYHGLDNRYLQVKMANLYIKACPSLLYVAPHCRKEIRSGRHGKIKIGFISCNFYNHTIGKHFRGIIANLSRELFEVHVFFGEKKSDKIAHFIEENSDRPVKLVPKLQIAREQIAQCELDILFYTDIGMDPLTYFLAFSRLAPVQCVTWGHPDTTGIPNIDYFISCEDFEAEGAETQYSEALVKMKNIPNFFYRPDSAELTDGMRIRERASVPDGKRLYVVPQSLFKIHPDFDAVLGEILRRDGNGHLILFDASQKFLRALLMDRFLRSIPDVTDRIIFLPRLTFNDFLSFIRVADVVLDTPYFCGGTTSLDIFSVGCPIVAWPGNRLASRFTFAYYRKMDIPDLLCDDKEQYIRSALWLAKDADWRKQISEKILERNSVLYHNQDSVRELEQFLKHAVEIRQDTKR